MMNIYTNIPTETPFGVSGRQHVDAQFDTDVTKIEVLSGTLSAPSSENDPLSSIWAALINEEELLLIRLFVIGDSTRTTSLRMNFKDPSGNTYLLINKNINLRYFRFRDQFTPYSGISNEEIMLMIMAA